MFWNIFKFQKYDIFRENMITLLQFGYNFIHIAHFLTAAIVYPLIDPSWNLDQMHFT